MPNTELSAIKRKRGSLKARLTNFEKFISNFNAEDPIESSQITELGQRLHVMESWLNEFDSAQCDIEAASTSEGLDKEYEERLTIENQYFKLISMAKEILNESHERESVESKSSLGSGSARSTNARRDCGVKLPKIELPKFCGYYSNWLEFRDTFSSLIHEQKSVSDIQKLHYLRASLEGEALKVIQAIEFTAVNYTVAWASLLERYDNQKVLINNHVRAIFEIEPMTKESANGIRKVIDDVSKNIRSLEQLKQPIKNWDTLIIYIISTKLDMVTLKEWENHSKGLDSPSLEEMKIFLRARAALLETLQISETQRKGKAENKPSRAIRGLLTTSEDREDNKTLNCPLCKKAHYIHNCGDLLQLGVNERVETIRGLKLCLNCLRFGHQSKVCRRGACKKCNLKHNTLLHYERSRVDDKGKHSSQISSSSGQESQKVVLMSQTENNYVLLSTAFVEILNKNRKPITIRALLDSGSQASYITQDLCDKLQLNSTQENISISGLNGMSTNITSRCELTLNSMSNNYSTKISCLVAPNVTGNLPSFLIKESDLDIPKNIKLADPHFYKPRPIDMLIGADLFWSLLCIGQISLGPNKPMLQKTKLGWVVAGPLNAAQAKQVTCGLSTVDVDTQLTRFWEIEEVAKERALSDEERACEEHFVSNVARKKNGAFVVRIPFKHPVGLLGDSYERAQRRFLKLERTLESRPTVRHQYIEFMREYVRLGHMSKVNERSNDEIQYYMPHHCVIKEESITTKLRVVFDASAATSSGYSLNGIQMCGPQLQSSLLSILLRCRQHAFIIIGDIEKMYRQVEVHNEDRKLQRILWRESKDAELEVFELNTVTYGTTSASFLAVRCLFQLAEESMKQYPELCKIIKEDFYVDDLISGANSIEEATNLANGVCDILKRGNFTLRKFCSNSERVLDGLKTAEGGDHGILKLGKHENAKTLGLNWCPHSDSLIYDIPRTTTNIKITKRTILSEIAQIFDPLGLLSPCIMNAKMMLQTLWSLKLTWDEALPLQIHEFWCKFREELPALNQLRIQRFVSSQNPQSVELHVFSDASERAYGACIYIRVVDQDGNVKGNLLCAKSKVAPLKIVSLPRLELSGALIAARLADTVVTSLRMNFNSRVFWTDSAIVLGWLRTQPNTLKTFVANRVAEVQQLTRESEWRHVPGKENPADIVSRGAMPKDILNHKAWWEGPSWLIRGPECWPTGVCADFKELPEVKENVKTFLLRENFSIVDFSRFSKLNRLKNSVAYALRFIENCKSNNRSGHPLSVIEIGKANQMLIKQSQSDTFLEEIECIKRNKPLKRNSRLLCLNPYIDSEGILRVGGRIDNSKQSFERKHPVILDAKHRFTRLIFEHEHERLLHTGPQQLLASIRETFWPIAGRNLAKSTFRRCVKCHKAKPRLMAIDTGQLPEARLQSNSVFNVVGVDYAGPIMTKDRKGRGAKLSKSYIALFICFSTKAVHLELVTDLSAECFLMAIRRFVSRRGIPKLIYSDNGRNFVAASKELSSFVDVNTETIQSGCSQIGIEWHFIPPYSPHFGGIWEAGVKSCKAHLKRVVGEAHLTFEELSTLLVQIEAILNSRPILPLTSHPDDLLPLTPAHFLVGRGLLAVPEHDLTNTPVNRLSRFKQIQQMQQHFWRRWEKEYIGELQSSFKRAQGHLNLEKDMLVLIKGENTLPTRWRLGRIVKVFPGPDGLARVATIKTSDGEIKRSFAKLSPLPTE